MGLKSPHILLAASNTLQMLENIKQILNQDALNAVQVEIDKNVIELFSLGEAHYLFAKQTDKRYWRQRISRFYYGVYNIRRSIQLHFSGVYTTDISDHKKIDVLPDQFPNASQYRQRLKDLREDRNLADYDHTASENDLLFTQDKWEFLVSAFLADARDFLKGRGITL
ncbi:MAG: hypothetical protein C4527_27900 [Candidatus Omnitrophota bacterium]|jgi:hypothetical protein|nr:MAG: hypothetical protein C4527_27900 [Candidatus Omnitrophota bacterium]